MRTTAAVLSLSLLTAAAASASATPAVSSPTHAGNAVAAVSAQYPGARVWIANDRDYFRPGDRMRVLFSTSVDSYVAVVHVDPDGYLDFVYPRSPWDSEYVRGGRSYAVERDGWSNGLLVRGGGGVGYFYVIASPEPLDYSHFRGRGAGWDWSYAGRAVSGDPFWAMEQITRLLLPRWSSMRYAADYQSYYIGGRNRYPSYACANRGFTNGWGWGYHTGWSSYYGSCDRLDLFLRDNPYYFDARRYRGDRRAYYRDYRDWDPRHGFKTDPRSAQAQPRSRVQGPEENQGRARAVPSQSGVTAPASRPAQRAQPASESGSRVAPQRQPTASPPASEPRARSTPAPVERRPERAEPTSEPRPRATPAPEQRRPAREQPAPQSRPRETAPRPAERTRVSEPQRSTTARSAPAASSRGSSGGASSSSPRSRRGDD